MDMGRGGGYGMDAEINARLQAKYDPVLENKCQMWIEDVTGEAFTQPFAEQLKDGVTLCKMLNTISPGTVKKINESRMPFKQMENVSNFLKGIRSTARVADHDCFETVDLFEARDIGVVCTCIHAYGAAVQKNVPDWKGAVFGVKLSQSNKREFTKEQLQNARSAVPMSSKGSAGIMERTKLDVSNNINHGALSSGDSVASGETTSLMKGSQGIMQRPTLNTSNNITFGNEKAGDSIFEGMGKISLGSSGVMERSALNTSNDIDFGNKSAGGNGSAVPTQMSAGSSQVMERSALDTSNNITFGNEKTEAIFVTAEHTYEPQEEGELGFLEGDKIQVLRKDDSGWWEGSCKGVVGVFPANYVA